MMPFSLIRRLEQSLGSNLSRTLPLGYPRGSVESTRYRAATEKEFPMALRATELNEDAPPPRRVRASALPPDFRPARNFSSVSSLWTGVFRGALTKINCSALLR
jgi:hypothetical protein